MTRDEDGDILATEDQFVGLAARDLIKQASDERVNLYVLGKDGKVSMSAHFRPDPQAVEDELKAAVIEAARGLYGTVRDGVDKQRAGMCPAEQARQIAGHVTAIAMATQSLELHERNEAERQRKRHERWLREHAFEDTDPHDYYRQYDAGQCTHCGKSESEHGGGK